MATECQHQNGHRPGKISTLYIAVTLELISDIIGSLDMSNVDVAHSKCGRSEAH